MPDSEFLESLNGLYKKQYLEYKKEELRYLHKSFDGKTKQKIIDKINKGIGFERDHDHLLNMCIFPFIQAGEIKTKLNYHFIRAEPLLELGIKNFDFLIYNDKSKVAIFGEVKASITAPFYPKVVKETRMRMKTVKANMEYIVENYLGEQPKICEFVIAVYSLNDDIVEEVSKSGGDIITWSVDKFHDAISWRSYRSEGDGLKLGILHKDKNLRKMLIKHKTSGNQYNLFPSSHFIVYLNRIIAARVTNNEGWHLSKADLKTVLQEELRYLDNEEFIDIKCDRIIRIAQNLNLIIPTDQKDLYKLIPQIANQTSLERKIKDLYLKYKIKEELINREHEAIKTAIERLEKFKRQRPELDEF